MHSKVNNIEDNPDDAGTKIPDPSISDETYSDDDFWFEGGVKNKDSSQEKDDDENEPGDGSKDDIE